MDPAEVPRQRALSGRSELPRCPARARAGRGASPPRSCRSPRRLRGGAAAATRSLSGRQARVDGAAASAPAPVWRSWF